MNFAKCLSFLVGVAMITTMPLYPIASHAASHFSPEWLAQVDAIGWAFMLAGAIQIIAGIVLLCYATEKEKPCSE